MAINKIMKIILIVCMVILAIAISSSLIYYYVFFRPANEKAEWEAEIKLKEEQLSWEKEKQQEEKSEELAQKKALAKCLDEADRIHAKAFDEIGKIYDSIPVYIIEYIDKERERRYENCYRVFGSD